MNTHPYGQYIVRLDLILTLTAADVSAAAAAIIKANDARGVAGTSAWQPALFLLDNLADNQ